MYSVDCCPKGLVIGKQGENEAEKVVIDFSSWASEFGAGVISARLKRPKDSAAYPVTLTTDGTTATWTVSATDTQYAGAGSIQLVYIVGDVVAKSVIWPVRVLPSLEAGEAPDPYESWLDTLEGVAAEAQSAQRGAEAARDAAEDYSIVSGNKANEAAASAQAAADSAASITGLTAVAQTLPEGSEASASFDAATDTLTLGIPKGDTGATGPAGPAGPKGDTGAAGADGFSPSASVTKQGGNITITITDKDGTTSETLEVDDALDDTSENPVENQVIQKALWNMLPVDTASGSIASFPDGADDVPMLSLKAQIEPVQDLHGYDSPWPAGGGKNKLNISPDIVDKVQWGIDVTVNRDNYGNCTSIVLNGTATMRAYFTIGRYNFSAGTILSGCPAGGTMQTYSLTVDGTAIADRGDGYTISEDVTNGNLMIVIGKDYKCENLTFRPMVRLASETDSTFAPYSNICPISGWDSVEVQRTGKNLLVLPIYFRATVNVPQLFFIKKGTYKLHFSSMTNATSWRTGVWMRDANGNNLSDDAYKPYMYYSWYSDPGYWMDGGNGNRNDLKITIVEDCYIRFFFCLGDTSASTVCNDAQLELGSTATDYEPFEGETINASWESEAGTVYGGTLDVVSGKLTATMAEIASYNGETIGEPWISDRDAYVAGTTPSIGAQVVYTLAEPIEYTLAGHEVRTLLGQNNIWNDCGNTSVTYRADIAKFIEKKVTS